MNGNQKSESRDLALENAIASNEIEGVEFTPAMRALLKRAIRENMSDEAFTQAAIEVTRVGQRHGKPSA